MQKLKEITSRLEVLYCHADLSSLEAADANAIYDCIKDIQDEILEIEKRANLNATYASPKAELVNHPSHYKSGKIECIDAMLDVFGLDKVLDFCELNAFKYLWRSNAKGTNLQDKQKAMWYLSKYAELEPKSK